MRRLRRAKRQPMLRIGDLANKSILVTGASSGIGAAISRAFAEQGARIAVHGSSNTARAEQVAQDIRAAGGFAQLVQGDLTVAGEAKRIVEDSAKLLDGLDVLINNAGSLVSRRPFLDTDDEWMDSVFDLNARAVVQTCQAAIPHLERRGGGSIINVGSIAGIDGGGSGAGIYGAAKAFVHNLTRHLARDFAARNIRVNTVSPASSIRRFIMRRRPSAWRQCAKRCVWEELERPAISWAPFCFSPQRSLAVISPVRIFTSTADR